MRALLNARELAEKLDAAPATIYGYAKRKLIPCYRLGDRILFDFEEVLQSLRQPSEAESIENLKKIVAGPAR